MSQNNRIYLALTIYTPIEKYLSPDQPTTPVSCRIFKKLVTDFRK